MTLNHMQYNDTVRMYVSDFDQAEFATLVFLFHIRWQ